MVRKPDRRFSASDRALRVSQSDALQAMLHDEVKKSGFLTTAGHRAVVQRFLHSDAVDREMEEAEAAKAREAMPKRESLFRRFSRQVSSDGSSSGIFSSDSATRRESVFTGYGSAGSSLATGGSSQQSRRRSSGKSMFSMFSTDAIAEIEAAAEEADYSDPSFNMAPRCGGTAPSPPSRQARRSNSIFSSERATLSSESATRRATFAPSQGSLPALDGSAPPRESRRRSSGKSMFSMFSSADMAEIEAAAEEADYSDPAFNMAPRRRLSQDNIKIDQGELAILREAARQAKKPNETDEDQGMQDAVDASFNPAPRRTAPRRMSQTNIKIECAPTTKVVEEQFLSKPNGADAVQRRRSVQRRSNLVTIPSGRNLLAEDTDDDADDDAINAAAATMADGGGRPSFAFVNACADGLLESLQDAHAAKVLTDRSGTDRSGTDRSGTDRSCDSNADDCGWLPWPERD